MTMTKFNFKTVTHSKSLSAFREVANGPRYFMVAGIGQNAATLVRSDKWLSCREMDADPENRTNRIENICQLFIENYRKAQLHKNQNAALKPAEEIIESIAVLWLDETGNAQVYQAGKCLFTILKRNDLPIPIAQSGEISKFKLDTGDRLLMDLKRAGLNISLRNTALSAADENELAEEFSRYDYPFALTFLSQKIEEFVTEPETVKIEEVILQPQPVKAKITPVIEEMTVAEEKVIDQKTIPTAVERTDTAPGVVQEEKIKQSSLNGKVMGTIIAVVLIISLVSGWQILRDPFNNNTENSGIAYEDDELMDSVATLPVVSTDAVIAVDSTQDPGLADAHSALLDANKYLQNGRNILALERLNHAEAGFITFLKQNPGWRSVVNERLSEIQEKRDLIKKDVNFDDLTPQAEPSLDQ